MKRYGGSTACPHRSRKRARARRHARLRAAREAFDPTKAPEIQERLLDGLADFELKPTGDAQSSGKLKNYTSSKNDGCGLKDANNVKVNQNCLNLTDTDLQGRGQAQNETSIADRPDNKQPPGRQLQRLPPRRRQLLGVRTASTAARPGATRTAPMGFTRGDAVRRGPRSTGRPAATPRSPGTRKGNAYLSCQVFKRGSGTTPNPDLSSAFFVFRSTGNDGASWNFPAARSCRARRRRRRRRRRSSTSS